VNGPAVCAFRREVSTISWPGTECPHTVQRRCLECVLVPASDRCFCVERCGLIERSPPRRQESRRPSVLNSFPTDKRSRCVVVIGSGVAGSAVATALCCRGHEVTLLYRSPHEGSSFTNQKWNHSGLLYPAESIARKACREFLCESLLGQFTTPADSGACECRILSEVSRRGMSGGVPRALAKESIEVNRFAAAYGSSIARMTSGARPPAFRFCLCRGAASDGLSSKLSG